MTEGSFLRPEAPHPAGCWHGTFSSLRHNLAAFLPSMLEGLVVTMDLDEYALRL